MNNFIVGAVVLDSSDKDALAQFYLELLDGEMVESNEHFTQIKLRTELRLTFQNAVDYVPPVWPEEPGKPQQMEHLDILVPDLDKAILIAEKLGAKKADMQFVPDMTVMIDPAGHPFCMIPMPQELVEAFTK